MVNARITGSSPNYRFTTESNTFDTAIATVENATGLPLTVGLAGLDADDRQVTVEIKSTNSNGPKTLVALDDTVVAVKVFIDASFTAGGAVQGTWLDTFPVTPTYRQLEATVTNEAVQTSGPSQLYLSTSGTVEITNGGDTNDDSIDVLADQTLLTDTPIAPGGSQTLSPPAGTTSLILQASTDSSIRRTVSLYDTTQPTVTITGADGVDAQPQVVTPPAADPGAVTIVNQQTSTALNAGWAGGPTTKILAWDGEGSPPSADFDTARSGTSPPPSAWYLDWEDTGDPDPKVVVKHLATTNGRGRPH